MASHVHSVTFDALDPSAQALWWSEVLAVPMSPDDLPGEPEGNEFCVLRSAVERAATN